MAKKKSPFISPQDYRAMYIKKVIELKVLEDEVVRYMKGGGIKKLEKLTVLKYPKDRFTHILK